MFNRFSKNRDYGQGSGSPRFTNADSAYESATPSHQGFPIFHGPSEYSSSHSSRPGRAFSRRAAPIANGLRQFASSEKFYPGHTTFASNSSASLGQRLPRSQSRAGSVNSNVSLRGTAVDNNVMATSADRSRTRRERTFVGSECAVCEEPLEHTLRGERVLQFSCAHVCHEACFYEFIRELDSQFCPTCDSPLHLDTSRGGNVIDLGLSCQNHFSPERLTTPEH
ncbi:von Willebrand factor type A domain [Geosmithia morbida]|uniref:von Willebrand factor type A domain n=1 Tax=Geosmithia morbida TaxID=1094350 RepID=A0A9P5D2C8_9HYPO|nr:von Willebrand factor type A domain [Geosmithia morbida]KAF4121351.1 von Willebrand factor type A domain [Geosmithia morbida]